MSGTDGHGRGYTARNRASWDASAEDYQATHGAALRQDGGLAWGVWRIPETTLRVLPPVDGLDVLELGCGAAQWSIGLARLGARAVGLDLSGRQLEHAQAAAAEAGLEVPLVQADAEDVPFAAASFDLVLCDHGAMSFTDPSRSVPEVSRVLRPGGLFVFSQISPLAELCWSDEENNLVPRLVRDYFGLHAMDSGDEVIFNLPYGEWIRLFRSNGFEILDLIEPRPAATAVSSYWNAQARRWARRWPGEAIWRLRRT